MSEESLHGADVFASSVGHCGEAVSEHVGCDAGGEVSADEFSDVGG